MMKSKRLILCLLGLCGWFVAVQAQTVALKTDLVNWATASLNLEPEVKVGRKSTMALGLSWNPWTFSDNKKWRHLRVQPEYRYWICRPFGGHFLGLHASYTRFNAGGVDLPFGLWPKLEDQRVQGNEWAVGLGYGYHWILRQSNENFPSGVVSPTSMPTSVASVATSWKSAPPTVSCPPSCPCLLFMCLSKANREDEENQ